jgi:adenylate cyclase
LKTNQFKLRLKTFAFLIAAFILSRFFLWVGPGIFEIWELRTIDKLFQLRLAVHRGVSEEVSDNLYLVYLSDSTVDRFCVQYHSGAIFSDITGLLSRCNTEQIGFDIIFERECKFANVSQFQTVVGQAGNVFLPFGTNAGPTPDTAAPITDSAEMCFERMQWHPTVISAGSPYYIQRPYVPTMEKLATAAKGLGSIHLTTDRDGAFRRLPLLYRFHEGYVPSFSFAIICDYFHVSPNNVIVDFGNSIILPGAVFPDGTIKQIVIPIDDEGRLILNFPGGWDCYQSQFPVEILFDAANNPNTFETFQSGLDGSIVIVSDMSSSGADKGAIPFQTNYPRVGLHLTALNTILTGNFLHDLDPLIDQMEEIILLIAIGIFSLILRPVKFAVVSILVIVSHVGFAIYLFLFLHTIPHVIFPSFLLILALISLLVYHYISEEREKITIRKTFTNYFSPAILEKIEQNPGLLSLGGEKKTLTVLFSDIVGFTHWSADQTPEMITLTLNEYFEEMARIVFKYDGYIDKFIGDGLMAFFGDPVHEEDHVHRCTLVAIEMQNKIRELRERWTAEGRLPINVRIGIHSGEMIVGNMGSRKRMEYTVIGSNVNLAKRLESNAPVGGILISESVYIAVKDRIQTKPRAEIIVRGIDSAVPVYEVIFRQ